MSINVILKSVSHVIENKRYYQNRKEE